MRRILSGVLAATLMTAVLILPSLSLAAPSPPPPADGQRARLRAEPLNPITYEYPEGSGTWYLDGELFNYTSDDYSESVPVIAPRTTIEYLNAADVVIGRETFRISANVLPVPSLWGYSRSVHRRLTLPSGAVPTKTRFAMEVASTDPAYPKYHWGIAARTAVFQEIQPSPFIPNTTSLGGGRTLINLFAYNNTSDIVGPVAIAGTEQFEDTSLHSLDAFDVVANNPVAAARLMPGETTSFTVRGLRATPVGATRKPQNLWVEAEPLPNADVWRFYNKRIGTHFYTADPAEKASVLANLSATYQLDGLAYSVREATPENDTPLHRFYNKKTGTHFYTASAAEKATVQNTMSATYNYEGVAYYVADTTLPGARAVWRFFNKKTGTHFYTASAVEKAVVQNTLSATYQLDGPAFYLAP